MKDITKLPRWARDRILDAERNVKFLSQQLAELSTGTREGPFYFESLTGEHPPYYLPHHGHLYFGTKREHITLYQSPHDPHELIIMATSGITVKPSSSNVIYVKQDR